MVVLQSGRVRRRSVAMSVARRLSFGLGLAAIAMIVACPAPPPRTSFSYTELRSKLPNGLRFVVMPDATTTQVEVDVRYDVGSREDPPGKAGIAHLVEHLMFQQRPDGPETAPLMLSINQLTTFFNAYTNWDTTHYMMASRVDQLDALLKIEAMRMYFRCQTITEDEFQREREVVRNEIRQRGGTAEGRIPDMILAEVYPKNHAYARMIGGDDSNLTSITLQDACDFMTKYYTPDRATVIVAGGVNPDAAAALIKKWFGPLDAIKGAPRVEVAPVTAVTRGKAEYELDIERPYVVIAWPLPASNTPEGRAVQFGLGSTWFRTAIKADDYDFAYSVQPLVLGGNLAPVFGMIIELKGMDKLDDAIDFVKKAAKSAHRGLDGGSWEQLEEEKARQKASFLESLETLTARTNTMGELIQFDRDTDFDSSEVYLLKEMQRAVDFDGSYAASQIKKYLDWDKAKVIVFKASKTGIRGDKRSKLKFETKSHEKKEIPEVDPREAKRPLKVAADFKIFEGVRRFEMSNGMKVLLLPLETPFPLVSARLTFNVGAVHSGGVPGIADFAASFRSLPMDAERFARAGISAGGFTTSDHTIFLSGGLDIYLPEIVSALERIVAAGEYSQEGLEGFQKNFRESFKRKDRQQRWEFDRQQLTALYGPDHPYTKNELLTPESVNGIGKDKLEEFRRVHYTAGNATLIIAGKFDRPIDKVEALVRSTFGSWDRSRVDEPIAPDQRARTVPEFIGVVGDELPQMDVAIQYPAPAGIDGQEAGRRVLAEMINLRMGDIRFKLGSTYGVYAGRGPRVGPTAYRMGGTVDAPRAGESLKAMRAGIQSLRDGVNFDVDFVRARRALIENLLGQSTVSSEMVARLATIEMFGLQGNYYDQLIKQIAAVSPAQVKMLITQELDPKGEIVVCLADRPTLERAFAEAGIEQVKIVEPDYR
jgi:zinc protease